VTVIAGKEKTPDNRAALSRTGALTHRLFGVGARIVRRSLAQSRGDRPVAFGRPSVSAHLEILGEQSSVAEGDGAGIAHHGLAFGSRNS